jgi:predicted ATPase
MRRARSADHWRRVYAKTYHLQVREVMYDGVPGIGTGRIAFRGGITAICGGNGVGKSTLLNAIAHSLSDTASAKGVEFSATALKAHLERAGSRVTIDTTFSPLVRAIEPSGPMPPLLRVDTGREGARLIEFVRSMVNRDELLEAYSPVELDSHALGRLGYVMGRQYERCEVFEVDEFEHVGVFPYFRVTSDGVSYGSESMGHGEFVLHWTMWMLDRAPKDSILLLEEPEAHVSAYSQEALLNVLAHTSEEKHIWVILTTHSAGILRRVPKEHVVLVFRQKGACKVMQAPTVTQLAEAVGLQMPVSGVALVEDRCAREFVRAWLHIAAPDVAAVLDVRDCGSASNVERVLRDFPKGSVARAAPVLVGLLDGGMPFEASSPPWLRLHLPMDVSPEAVLRSAGEHISLVSTITGRDEGTIGFVLSAISGLDHHDWLEELSRRLGIAFSDMIRVLVQIWLAQPQAHEKSAGVISELRQYLDLS